MFRLNEQHGSSLYRAVCAHCCDDTLHGRAGCIHCGTIPKPSIVGERPFRYGKRAEVQKRILAPHEPKHCRKCGTTKRADAFSPQAKSKDGRQWECRECARIAAANLRAKKRAAG